MQINTHLYSTLNTNATMEDVMIILSGGLSIDVMKARPVFLAVEIKDSSHILW